MPIVNVRYNPRLVDDKVLELLSRQLPEAVAYALSCGDEGGSLTAKDIDVFFDESNPFDNAGHPLNVRVEAKDYPSRVDNLDDRAEALWQMIWAYCASRDFGLWVVTATAAWVEHSSNAVKTATP